MFRWSVLLGALLATAPTIWAAFAEQSVDVTSALEHYLVAWAVIAVLLGLVRSAMKPGAPEHRAERRGNAEPDR